MAKTTGNPTLQPLYFENANETEDSSLLNLPSEIIHHCLVQYSDWGDLAKLACVRKGWSNILMDAANMDTDSKWELAQALMEGTRGCEQNYELAMKPLLELANVDVKVNHDNHKVPVTENQTETRKCFAPAMKAIAQCYLEGNGVVQDSAVGVTWLEACHSMGDDVTAAHELALVHEYGHHGVEIDIIAAAEWFRVAAELGHLEAMAELGLCYELGCGVEQSDTLAIEWYMKAANLGHLPSKYSVGEAFEEARGVPQSDEEACLWYYRAAVEGDNDSKNALRRLEEIARIVVPGVGSILNE